MPRAIWTGSIGFGLVNVPVRMYSAVEEHDLHFHYVHAPDGSRIAYQKVCRAEDRPVADEEIVKAFEFEKGEYVYMTEEDFEAAEAEGGRTIDIRVFVPYEEIDPIYFERTYYLGPGQDGEKVYALLLKAMERSGLAAVAKFVMRDRQHLGCLRVREGVITLERMHFADEIRATREIAPKEAKVEKQELVEALKAA
jgi:DNA end-binding protein Ku